MAKTYERRKKEKLPVLAISSTFSTFAVILSSSV